MAKGQVQQAEMRQFKPVIKIGFALFAIVAAINKKSSAPEQTSKPMAG